MITPTPTRHPLGLPPGSVRAILALMVAGLLWTVLVQPPERPVELPPFLFVLLSLIMVFFVSHGDSIAAKNDSSPLYLPAGSVRLILVLGTAAAVAWPIYKGHGDTLRDRLTPLPAHLGQFPYLIGAVAGAFLLGQLLGRGPWRGVPAFKDILASLSLVCMLGLLAEMVTVLFINPSVTTEFTTYGLDLALSAGVALYFGARS